MSTHDTIRTRPGPAVDGGGSDATACTACGSSRLVEVLTLASCPVHVGVLWPDPDAARACPRGRIRLVWCRGCDFLFNAAFDASLVHYELAYDNALHFSPYFRDYERGLVARLVERYDLRGRLIAEAGCGNGHFLGLLCAAGASTGRGYDPSHDPVGIDPLAAAHATISRELLTPETAASHDFVVARHVLEHVAEPRAFVRSLRAALAGHADAAAYVEVPNALLALRQRSIWDVIYEHCGYYTAASLVRLFHAEGFDVLDVHEAYEGQFLGIEARPARPAAAPGGHGVPAGEIGHLVASFAEEFARVRERWDAQLARWRERRERVALWGAGAKATTFMNVLANASVVDRVVDLKPAKQGSYLAGTGHEIQAPERLATAPPTRVVLLNPVYRDEVRAALEAMGLGGVRVVV